MESPADEKREPGKPAARQRKAGVRREGERARRQEAGWRREESAY